MGILLAEFEQALRRLLREWGFTLTFVLTLALAIGANGAVFAALDAYLFPPLPYAHSERLMIVQNHLKKTGWEFGPPYLSFSKVPGIAASARFDRADMTVVINGTPQSVPAAKATPGLFTTLGVRPFIGRWAAPAAGKEGGPREVVLSYGFWQSAFNGNRDIFGQPLKIDGVTYRIVGVAPHGFFFPTRHCAFWIPLTDTVSPEAPFSVPNGPAIVRLAPHAKLEHVVLALNMRLQRMIEGTPAVQQQAELFGYSVAATPVQHWLGQAQKNNLLLMQAGALVLLLLAAANLGNLSLVRALHRQHEFALRMALGARRQALLRIALVEALPLGLLAGSLGLAMARYAAAALGAFGIAAADTPYRIAFSAPVTATVLVLALIVAAAAMITPLLITGGKRLDTLLKQAGAQSGGSRKALKVRQSLSSLQIALAVLLLSGATLIGLSLNKMISRNPGFETDHLVAAKLSLRGPAYETEDQKKQAWHVLRQEAAALPGVESAGVGYGVPFTGYSLRQNFKLAGDAESDPGVIVNDIAAGEGLLETLDVTLLSGRLLTSADFKNRDDWSVVVVDRRFAQTIYGTTDVVGRYLSGGHTTRIVGVIGSLNGTFAWQGSANGTMIAPAWSFTNSSLNLVVRSPLAPTVVARELRTMLNRIMPDQSFTKIAPMSAYIAAQAGGTSAIATLMLACGVIALALASIGTYGVIAQLGRARRREFAVRIALGAQPGQIERLVLRSGIILWAIGSLAGVGLAIWMGLLFSDRLYKVSVFDPAPYVAAAGLIGVIVLLASWLPARSARRLDLSDALHSE